MAMQAVAKEGRGAVIYEYQEGRGIGLMAKLQAFELQDVGIDTVEANHALGFKADCRDFSLPAAILRDLGIRGVRLLTNNPHKSRALFNAGIEIVAQIPCETAATPYSLRYLRTKKEKMGHALTFLHYAGIHDEESACIGENAPDLQQTGADRSRARSEKSRPLLDRSRRSSERQYDQSRADRRDAQARCCLRLC
jgi:hypothetical protein